MSSYVNGWNDAVYQANIIIQSCNDDIDKYKIIIATLKKENELLRDKSSDHLEIVCELI